MEFVKAEGEYNPDYAPDIILDETLEEEMLEISEKEGISKAEAMGKIADNHWTNVLEDQKKLEKMCKEKGIPVTEKDYKEQLIAEIEKNKRMNAKYQRRLDRINNRKD